MTEVEIPVDGQRVRGFVLHPPAGRGPVPGVVFVHGWGSSQRQDLGKARRLRELGFACLTFNLRGHARTWRQRQTVTRSENLRDLLAAFDYLAGRGDVEPTRLGVVGSSYGGYLAALLVAERKPRWLALEAPALYKDADFDRPKRELNLDADLPAYRRRRLPPAANRALAGAAGFEGDVLLVEGECDRVIPHEVVANYRVAFAGARSLAHVVIPGADHGLTQRRWRDTYRGALVDWFAARLADTTPPLR
jgi:dienelactone hydrolase